MAAHPAVKALGIEVAASSTWVAPRNKDKPSMLSEKLMQDFIHLTMSRLGAFFSRRQNTCVEQSTKLHRKMLSMDSY
jgi:hypothetical protein